MYTRYILQGLYRAYVHIRRIHTVLANSIEVLTFELDTFMRACIHAGCFDCSMVGKLTQLLASCALCSVQVGPLKFVIVLWGAVDASLQAYVAPATTVGQNGVLLLCI